MSPMDFMVEGGVGMWPVLVFGLVTLVASARYAWRPAQGRLGFSVGMIVTTLSATVHTTWIDLGSVFRYLESPERAPDAEIVRILMVGLKESTRPGALGGIFVTLALLLVSIGLQRKQAKARGTRAA